MKKYYLYKIVCLLLLVTGNFSCTSDLNFDQVNDLKLTPVYEANFSYFDIPATAFVTSTGSEIKWDSDVEEFDVFRDKYLNSYLQKVDFYFEINNTINRAFKFNIVLLDANSNTLTSMNFDIPAYSGSSNVVKKTEVFENSRLELLKRARKMRFFIELQSGPALNSNSIGDLVLRSSATVYLEI
ncbi:hypothetical protein [Flavobacterium flavipallidum]|uniref:Gliding motility-associated lipoprotein GldH n=1 Tax=Flavobacterium flavipallidum TaxID=3139140 RepID=A0ABU9HPX7_9FLAO